MKKVKIMLASIAVLAVVGGAFAFKANTFINHKIYTIPNAQGMCTQLLTSRDLTIEGTPAFATNIFNTPCVETFTKVVLDAQ